MNVIQLLRVALFLHFCVTIPWISALNDSCPCRLISECPNGSEELFGKGQLPVLPCESDHLTRCCSTIPKSMESAIIRESSSKDEVMDAEIDSAEKLKLSAEKSTISENSTEYSADTLQTNLEKLAEIPVPSSVTVKIDDEVTDSDVKTLMNSKQKPLQQVFPRVGPVHRVLKVERIFNESARNSPLPREQISLKHKQYQLEVNNKFMNSEIASENVQDLIAQVARFESFRTLPKRPDSLLTKDSKKQEQKFPGNINSLIPGKASLTRDYYLNVNSKFPPILKRVVEKSSDPLEQKTSLGTLLTLDGASIRAINENANSSSNLDDHTSIKSLSDPEDAENIKRVTRSHASELDEKSRKETKNISLVNVENPTVKQDEKKELLLVKGFKRPPRVLPIRNLRNEQQTSGKFANSRERARSLFDKSNETRRRQVSFIINRNDTSLKKNNSGNNTFVDMEKVENGYGNFNKNETIPVAEEHIPRLVDKNVTDFIEIL